MNVSAYHKTEEELYEHYKKTAQADMKQMTYDIRKTKLKESYTDDAIVDIDASFECTWQKRGYSSLNGMTTAITRTLENVFDYRIMTKKCKACER